MVPTGLLSAVGAEKQREKRTGHEINRANIDVQQTVEVFRLGRFDGADVTDACVVYEDVETGDLADERSGD